MTLAPSSLWPTVAGLAAVQWPPRDSDEAVRFVQLAERERLFALLLEESELPAPVAGVLPQFRALDALHKRRYELSRQAVIELIRVAGAESFALLKGSDYRFRFYPKPTLRPLADIDFFVPRADIPRVTGLLSAAGHRHVYSSHGVQWTPGYYESKYLIGEMNVELHRSFFQPIRARIPYDAVWQRREWFHGDGYRALRLGPVDALVHHALSMAKDEFSVPLIRYVDMSGFLGQPDRDLRACVETAREWQTEAALYASLRLTVSLFPEVHDTGIDGAMSALLSARRRILLDRAVLPDPRSEPSGHARGRFTQLWRKLWLIDRVWRRVAFFASHWASALAGHGYEWMSEWRQRKSR